MTIITFFLFICGLYLLFNSVKMKSTGSIPKGLISNKINLDRAKDIPGYIQYMFIRGIIFGVFLCVFSAILILNEFVEINSLVMLAVQVGYAVCIIYYAVVSIKAQNKFLF